jgi:WD40 repeat protein
VWDVIVTPDGREAVSASNDHTVRVWDLRNELLRAVLEGHSTWVCSVAVNGEGTLIAAGARDGCVRCWDLRTTEEVCVLPAGAADAKVAWMADDRLIIGDRSGCVRLWRFSEGRWVLDGSFNPHEAAILKIIPTGYDDEVATAATDGKAVVWCVKTGEIRAVLEGHSGDVNSVAICRAEAVAITGGTDGKVVVWSLESGAQIATLVGHRGVVWRVAVSEEAGMIASGSGRRNWKRFRPTVGVPRQLKLLGGQLVAVDENQTARVERYRPSPRGANHMVLTRYPLRAPPDHRNPRPQCRGFRRPSLDRHAPAHSPPRGYGRYRQPSR